MVSAIITVSSLLGLAAASIPVIPGTWTISDFATGFSTFEGGTYNETSRVACCHTGSPKCQVVAQGMTGTYSSNSDPSVNATNLNVGPTAEIMLYNERKLGMDIIATRMPSDKGWNCTSWCPIDEWFSNPIGLGNKNYPATDNGTRTIDGKQLELYVWHDGVGKLIPMEELDEYVDITTDPANPVPIMQAQKLTPYGGAPIGEGDSIYGGWKAQTPPASDFNVVNVKTCPKGSSDDCNDQARNGLRGRRVPGSRILAYQRKQAPTLLEQAQKAAAVFGDDKTADMMASSATKSTVDAAKWPTDYISDYVNELTVNQGGYAPNPNELCCAFTHEGQCQVRLQTVAGRIYHDVSHNRTRFESSTSGQVTVTDFNVHKQYLVFKNDTVQQCLAYCPIDPNDVLEGGKADWLDANAKDLGEVTYKGQKAEHYEWKDYILKVIQMQVNDVYIHNNGTDFTPLAAVATLTPFGKPNGAVATTTWSNFQPGTPPASLFDIKGTADCPENPNCGNQEWQAYRLSHRLLHTYASYEKVM